ncbi:MAG: threonine/serine dehydratase [Gemmatimonadaceae bacterium]
MPSLDDIRAARQRIAGRVHLTPMLSSQTIADRASLASLALKCESLQKTGSFKVRGALNAVSLLDDEARARGVVTVSAGNHAQALAWAAQAAGTRCTVVMPAAASETKAAASAGYGARVIRHGTGAEAFARARELAAEHGFTLIHPFDDARIVAGAASVGAEIVEQMPEVEMVIVPIGGGGLIAGVASGIKQTHPHVRIVGVEPEGAAVMRMSLDAGRPMTIGAMSTIADGLAAPFAGDLPFAIVRDFVDDVVLVTDAEIAGALSLLLTRAKLLAEPAGAAATAALLGNRIPSAAGKRVVSIVSGGNVDPEKLKCFI